MYIFFDRIFYAEIVVDKCVGFDVLKRFPEVIKNVTLVLRTKFCV
jgi:hypothetical protein